MMEGVLLLMIVAMCILAEQSCEVSMWISAKQMVISGRTKKAAAVIKVVHLGHYGWDEHFAKWDIPNDVQSTMGGARNLAKWNISNAQSTIGGTRIFMKSNISNAQATI